MEKKNDNKYIHDITTVNKQYVEKEIEKEIENVDDEDDDEDDEEEDDDDKKKKKKRNAVLSKLKIREVNRIRLKIKENTVSIEVATTSIINLKRCDIKDSLFVSKTTEKNNLLIALRTKENDDLSLLLTDVENGLKDNELLDESKQADEKMNKKDADKNIEKKKVKDEEKKNNTFFKKKIDKLHSDDRQGRYAEKDMDYSLRYYRKISDTIPSFITENLKTMPANKGYIFNGMWLFGNLPIKNDHEKDGWTLFEKKGGSLFIHSYTPKEYNLYEKKGTNYKELINSQPRRFRK